MSPVPAAIDLRLIDPPRNRFRHYCIRQGRTLFGEPFLVIEWGRVGRRLRVREETFADGLSLEQRRGELLARRRRHGYVVSEAVDSRDCGSRRPVEARLSATG
jgi:predicted DNA-binding WGR domain protein